MKISPWLVIKRSSPYRASTRTTVSQPALASNEIAFKLNIDIPDALFSKPRLEAKIVIPDDAVSPPVISAEVMDDIASQLKKQTGYEVHVSVDLPETKNDDEDEN